MYLRTKTLLPHFIGKISNKVECYIFLDSGVTKVSNTIRFLELEYFSINIKLLCSCFRYSRTISKVAEVAEVAEVTKVTPSSPHFPVNDTFRTLMPILFSTLSR